MPRSRDEFCVSEFLKKPDFFKKPGFGETNGLIFMKMHNFLSWHPLEWLLGGLFLLGFYFLSQYSYLLFHSLVELCSIIVACGIFMIAWNSRHIAKSPYIEFLGTAYLFIAILDILHTLTYTGVYSGIGSAA